MHRQRPNRDLNVFPLDLDSHTGCSWIGLYLLHVLRDCRSSNSISSDEEDLYLLSDKAFLTEDAYLLSDEIFLNRQEEFMRNANLVTVYATRDLLSEEMFVLQVKEYPELRQTTRELGLLQVKRLGGGGGDVYGQKLVARGGGGGGVYPLHHKMYNPAKCLSIQGLVVAEKSLSTTRP